MTTSATLNQAPSNMDDLVYDRKAMEVRGKDFSIKYYSPGRPERGDGHSPVFIYKDADIEFYFSAIRGSYDDDFRLIDSGFWQIFAVNLWGADNGCVREIPNISERVKTNAKKNIKRGMMLMEALYETPPQRVSAGF